MMVLNMKILCGLWVCAAALLAVLAEPLFSLWSLNYGNIMASTAWGPVTRGFSDGPSPLWLLGNLCPIYLLFSVSTFAMLLTEQLDRGGKGNDNPGAGALFLPIIRFFFSELEHLGQNVLLYLVVGDVCLAGLWRGKQNEWPLDTRGCGVVTLMICLTSRFIHYLGASSR